MGSSFVTAPSLSLSRDIGPMESFGDAAQSQAGDPPLSRVPFWQAEVVWVDVKTTFLLQLEERDGEGLGSGDIHKSLPMSCCLVVGCWFSKMLAFSGRANYCYHGCCEILIVCESLQDGGNYMKNRN